MTPSLQSKFGLGALLVGGFAFLNGLLMLGYSPLPFAVAAGFTLMAAVFGRGGIRVAGICLCAASLALGVHHFERQQHIEALIRAVRERAATNSVSK